VASFADVEASVRAAVFQEDTGRLPQATILLFCNEEFEELVRRVSDFAPDLWAAVSGDLTVAAGGTTLDISSLTTLLKIQEVQRKESGRYAALDPAGRNAEIFSNGITWRQRGFPGAGCVVELFPPESAPGTYRVRYVAKPSAIVAGTNPIALPPGGQRVLVESIAARLRAREKEDPSFHLAAREKAFDNLRRSLTPKGTVVQTGGRY
jgi:hypothetical protein